MSPFRSTSPRECRRPSSCSATTRWVSRIQRAFRETKVVKALNTVNCQVMVDPSRVPGDHDIFVSGDDTAAKATVTEILRDWFGWKSVIDLGDITTARGTEAYLLLWLQLWGTLGSADFNIKVIH